MSKWTYIIIYWFDLITKRCWWIKTGSWFVFQARKFLHLSFNISIDSVTYKEFCWIVSNVCVTFAQKLNFFEALSYLVISGSTLCAIFWSHAKKTRFWSLLPSFTQPSQIQVPHTCDVTLSLYPLSGQTSTMIIKKHHYFYLYDGDTNIQVETNFSNFIHFLVATITMFELLQKTPAISNQTMIVCFYPGEDVWMDMASSYEAWDQNHRLQQTQMEAHV